MANDNGIIINKIKESYEKAHDPNSSIKFPSGLTCILLGNNIQLLLTNVTSNMQTDSSAFEGWALVIKRWTNIEKIILCWEPPEHTDNQHYQRFLFRVIQFAKTFPEWFEIVEGRKEELFKSKIVLGWTYFLNTPSLGRKEPDSSKLKGESQLEALFYKNSTLKSLTNAYLIDRQLPVGVFSGNPCTEKNQIFTGKKSAIDLWGINYDDKLLLFELKDKGNKSVGIVSELLFYSFIIWLLQQEIFYYPPTKNQNIHKICNTHGILSYFLAPELHPLIDYNLVQMLNEALMPDVEFHHIKFDIKALDNQQLVY